MTQAGDLDRRVTFQRAAETEGPYGTVQTWADHGGPVWASFSPVRDTEKYAAGQVSATMMARFVLRWSALTSGIDAKDRLICDGQTFEVIGVKPIGRREWIEITGVRGSDDGPN